MMRFIYKIVPRPLWEEACKTGVFTGAPVDRADGFIHFSGASQVAETANKHFCGQHDLLLLCVDTKSLGAALRYEVSRNNALFPHLYGDLPVHCVHEVLPFRPDAAGRFSFSDKG